MKLKIFVLVAALIAGFGARYMMESPTRLSPLVISGFCKAAMKRSIFLIRLTTGSESSILATHTAPMYAQPPLLL